MNSRVHGRTTCLAFNTVRPLLPTQSFKAEDMLIHAGANLPNTDTSPADEIGLAAVQILCHLWKSTGEERYLLRAIICLRRICDDSPSCAHARYLLIRLYRLAGERSPLCNKEGPADRRRLELGCGTPGAAETGRNPAGYAVTCDH